MKELLGAILLQIRMIAELAADDASPTEKLILVNALRVAIRKIEGLA